MMKDFSLNFAELNIYGAENEKEASYEKFRKFCKETNREGKTLPLSAPVRFSSTKSLAALRVSLLHEAFKPGNRVLATSLMVPPELAWATGYIPLNLEMFAGYLASHSGILSLAARGSLNTRRCSFLNTLLGAQKEGIVPKPDIVVSSSAYCDEISYVFEDVSYFYGTKHEHLDLPLYLSSMTIDTVAENLEHIFDKACFTQGINKKDGIGKLRQVMYNSYQARKKYLEIWELRKQFEPLNLGLEPLHWQVQFLPLWGDPKFPKILDRLKNEIIRYIDSNKDIHKGLPVAIYSLIPYGGSEVWDKMLEYEAFTTFEGVNYMGDYQIPDLSDFDSISASELFFNMALNLVNTPFRGEDIHKRTHAVIEEIKDLGSEGLIIFQQEHCQLLSPRISKIETIANKFNINTVLMGGDCVLGQSKDSTSTRLEYFLSSLLKNQSLQKTDKQDKSANGNGFHENEKTELGFDNHFSKFIMLDKSFDNIKQSMFDLGIE